MPFHEFTERCSGGLHRRSFLGGGLALVGASFVPMPAFGALTTPLPARRFVDSVGICTHAHWGGTLWQTTNWESLFLDSGVAHTRGKVGRGTGGKAALTKLQPLFNRGVKICATVADQKSGLDRSGTKANLDFLANVVGAHNLSGIESANEYNNPSTKPTTWAAELRDFQKWLRDTVRANPAFNNVPLIAPSMWGRLTEDYKTLGNLEPNADRGCMHWYTGGRRPSIAGSPSSRTSLGDATYYHLRDAIREAKVLAPTKPLRITEYGYPIAGPNDPLSGYVITERAAAKYIIRGLLDAFADGVEQMHIYSLIDDVHRSKYHGLCDGTLKRRLTFYAVKNLMALFADSKSTFTVKALDFSLSNLTSSIKRQLFQKSDGSYLLTMYQDVDSYDRRYKRDSVVAPVSIGLSLPRAARIDVYTPSIGASVTKSVSNTNSLSIPVGDHVTVVKITPGTTTTSVTTSSTSSSPETAEPTSPPAPTPSSRDPFEFKTVPKDRR